MKVLLLSLALLFFTGAQGRHFWQSDEPTQENQEKVLLKIYENTIAIFTDVVKNLEYSEIAKEYKFKEKFQAAKHNADKLEKVIEDYIHVIWEKGDAKLHEKFPVLRTKVIPIMKEFDDKLEEHLETFVKEFVPIGSELFHGVTKHLKSFAENLGSIAEQGRDKLREEVDSLRVKLQPYVEDVRAEYEKYSKDVTDTKKMKENLEKQVDALREHAKAYFKDLKKHGGENAEEIWKKVDRYLKEFYDASN